MTCAARDAVLPKGGNVTVNGVAIPREEIAREIQHHPSRSPAEAWRAAARSLVVRELLIQEARRIGVQSHPICDDAGRRETEDESLIRGLIEREVVMPKADDQSCRRYYEQNRAAFKSAPIYEVAHILFAARRSEVDSFARARVDAEAVTQVLKAHPERFAELARAHSACPSGAQGGNLGQITSGQTTPEFEAAVRALAEGAMTDVPIETRYGFHIIRLDRKIEGRDLPYEIVAERIAAYLSESVTRRATAQYIARLASRSEIVGVVLPDAAALRVY